MNNSVEKEYIANLVEHKFDALKLKEGILSAETVKKLDAFPNEIKDYLNSNTDFASYSEADKDAIFGKALEILESFKETIRTASCQLQLKGRDLIWIKNRIEDDVELTSESVFVAIHLYGTWLKDQQTSINENANTTVEIELPNTIVLYDLLSTLKYKGLSQKALIYAKILKELAECSKYFQHYNSAADRAYKAIAEWNLGLSADDKAAVKNAILQNTIAETSTQNS